MKYIISEGRLNQYIYEHLTSNYTPDYGWEGSSFYTHEVERWEIYIFYKNDFEEMFQLKSEDYEEGIIHVAHDICTDLSMLFHDRWKPIFIKWFSENSGIKVNHINCYW